MAKKYSQYVKKFRSLGYEFRYNIMMDAVECNEKRLTDVTAATIKSRMADKGFTRRFQVEEAWVRLAGENEYHPIKEYFDGLEWKGEDIFGQLMGAFDFKDRAISHKFIWKFLVGAVAKVYDGTQNFMLIIDGGQGIGKSYFVRWLCPPDIINYFVEGALNPDNKDTQTRVVSNFLWEVGEFQSTTRKADQEALKNVISQQVMTVRRPWGKYDIEKPIIASFIGTINENGYGLLTDTTGSRRFATIKMNAINHEYTKLDIDQLWAQIMYAYKNGADNALTHEESREQSQINENYQIGSHTVQMLHKYYEINSSEYYDEWLPTADIITNLELQGLKGAQRMLLMDISSELLRNGCERSNSNKVTGRGRLTCYNGIREKMPVRVGL